jgi:D-alanyl-D-alanine carboxypeptidase/D-alanyl-D-alanine-endopeptidase (penicillin-binding protein 4)
MAAGTGEILSLKFQIPNSKSQIAHTFDSMKIFQFLLLPICILFIIGCTASNHISKDVTNSILHSNELENAHVGISIYDATDNKSVYQYQSNKYFVPASNTKLFTCYAALKYLGDSITGIMYAESDTAIILLPTGDPTLLHRDYQHQPVIDLLKKTQKKVYVSGSNWREQALGFGWSWDDYNDDYMAERSPLPVYGNVIQWIQERDSASANGNISTANTISVYSSPEVNWKIRFTPETSSKNFFVQRRRDENVFEITEGTERKKAQDVPFVTDGLESALSLLRDTINKEIKIWTQTRIDNTYLVGKIKSQPLDSMLRPMMYRSDNFFAEQSLLMVSQQLLGYMSDSRAIDSLLKLDLAALPQRPRWVDGSGLSRFNLFSPDDFVWLLQKMKNEFGMDRLQQILPTGGSGTLSNFFKDEKGVLFAKTGTLSGQVALSGFLYTKKNKLFIFSILVNNHNASATGIRKTTESFLKSIRVQY